MGAPGPATPRAIALDIAGVLEILNIRYAITGSVASGFHGEPRATLDVDLIADLRPAAAAQLVDAIGTTYYIDASAVRRTRTGDSFNAIHLASTVKVDIFVTGDDPFEQERLRRRIRIALPDSTDDALWVDAAEGTILRKLEWYRRGGEVSDRQWRDVNAIFRLQGDALDQDFLDLWAPSLGVVDLLARARSTAFADPTHPEPERGPQL
jgi:hypothetical protein